MPKVIVLPSPSKTIAQFNEFFSFLHIGKIREITLFSFRERGKKEELERGGGGKKNKSGKKSRSVAFFKQKKSRGCNSAPCRAWPHLVTPVHTWSYLVTPGTDHLMFQEGPSYLDSLFSFQVMTLTPTRATDLLSVDRNFPLFRTSRSDD